MFNVIVGFENHHYCNGSLNQNIILIFKREIQLCLQNLEKCMEDGIDFNLNEVDTTTPSQSNLLVHVDL